MLKEEKTNSSVFSGGQNVTLGWVGGLEGITYRFGGAVSQPKIKLKTTNDLKKKTIKNVVGTIRGAVEPDRYVIIGTHRDAWVYGAADAAAGTAAMIEIMTAMSKTMKVSYGKSSERKYLGTKCLVIRCLGPKCLGIKCLGSKYLRTKCLGPKCLRPKCLGT